MRLSGQAAYQDNSDVVGLDHLAAEIPHAAQQDLHQFSHRFIYVLSYDICDPILAELFARSILVLIDAIGDQRQHIARIEVDTLGSLQIPLMQCTHRERRCAMPMALICCRAVVQQRTLAAGVEADIVGYRIKDADKRGYEPVIR